MTDFRFETRTPKLLAVALILGMALTGAAASSGEWQSPESIRDAAREFVNRSLAGQRDVVVDVRGVDDRVKLPACSQPLDAYAERALRNGQGSVAVACSGDTEWRLFVPVRASHTIEVVVTTGTLTRGQRVSSEDVHLSSTPTTSLPYEYLTRLEDVVGMRTRRSIPVGTIVVPSTLDRLQLVQRGGLVTLIAGTGGIMVKSEGTALEDAALTERVRVRTKAGRVVEGTVESQNQVRVGPLRPL